MRIVLNHSNLNRRIISQEKELTQFERVTFWFSVFDLLFLPYFPLMSVSFSVPLVAIWMALHGRELLTGKEGRAFFIMAAFMIFGTAMGAFYSGTLRWETSFSTTVKRFFQYIICFGYYFFYKYTFRRRSININKIFIAFGVYATLLALFFLFNPHTYAEIKMIINPVDNHTARYLAGTQLYRFNYLWTDPNNIAYLFDAVVVWFALDNKEPFANKLVVILLAIVIDLATASNGGIIILAVSLIYIVAMQVISLITIHSKVRSITLATIVFAIIIAYFVFRYTNLSQIIQTELIDKLRARMMIYSSSQNLSGGRLDDLKVSIKYLNPILLLSGVGKEGFSTENGHLYWIGMYGFPSYLGFMYIVFAKFKNVSWRRYIWIFPLFIAFTLNIAIGEFKWFAILLLLLAASRYDDFYKEKSLNE